MMSNETEKTIERLKGARKFVENNTRSLNGFKITGIYQHFCTENLFIFHIRTEGKSLEGKPDKRFDWISFDGKKYFNGYRHLEFFKSGGKFKPFAGVSLKNPSPPPIREGDTVFIVEGHKHVSFLIWKGLKAITSGGGSSFSSCEWESLPKNLNLIIWPDNDRPGKNYAVNVARILEGLDHTCKFIDYQSLNLPDRGDVLDWHKDNPEATKADILALACVDTLPPDESDHTAHDEWGKPIPLDNQTLPANSLPYEALPDCLVPWIKDEANRMPAPPDWTAVSSIILSSSLIGTRCSIRPHAYDDWLCVVNLWGGAIGSPSTMKSPCLAKGIAPLNVLEKEAFAIYEDEQKEYFKLKCKHDAKAKGVESALKREWGKTGKNRRADTINFLQTELDAVADTEPVAPICKRYRVEDITAEKCGELLAENPHGLLVFCDELAGLFARWNKSGRESERAFFLKAFEGKQADLSDKIGRGSTRAERVCLAICGAITPDKLQFYLYESIYGEGNDGLFQRFQLFTFPDNIPDYNLLKKYPDLEARARAHDAIIKIASMDFESLGAEKQGGNLFAPFGKDGQEIYNEWVVQLETNLREKFSDYPPVLLEHFGKYRSLMPSLALNFQVLDTADMLVSRQRAEGPLVVSADNALKARVFTDEYLASHAFKTYGLVLNSKQRGPDMLAGKIKTGKVQDGFTIRDIARKNWAGLEKTNDIKEACNALKEKNWIKEIDTRQGGFGGEGTVKYLINPAFKKD